MKSDLELLNDIKVGIVGCGHLGQAIARALIDGGIEKGKLLISYRGNPLTYQKLEAQGLASCLATNERVFGEAGIVLLTVKPQDLSELRESVIQNKALIASCIAGVPLETLSGMFGANVIRMMLSGPDTIASGKGVAAIYPQNENLKLLLGLTRLTQIKIMTENDLDIFTAGVCLTAALLKEENPDEQVRAIDRIGGEYPLLSELYTWAKGVLPKFENDGEKKDYIAKMLTKGGVTDAIISNLERGASLDVALKKGIERTKEISIEIQKSITERSL